jgi:hypothetical protein
VINMSTDSAVSSQVHTYIHTYICTPCMYVHMYINTYMHTYICTYTYMYVHTYMCTYVCSVFQCRGYIVGVRQISLSRTDGVQYTCIFECRCSTCTPACTIGSSVGSFLRIPISRFSFGTPFRLLCTNIQESNV